MNDSISYCIRHDILKDVLLKNRSEVRHMLLTEFDERKFAKSMWKEGHEENFKTGIFHSKMALVRATNAIFLFHLHVLRNWNGKTNSFGRNSKYIKTAIPAGGKSMTKHG